ncbi:hypothetical protein HanXRQr2_Chr11g0517321 [Helianthus annuus]|uniref:Endonuclease/exonuclease/phosphatase n=1 Tax=Helianthus annuus TaxID=4232 RepID=A0A251TFE8_HELAN|nr:hypothetical protein HanXRQr2_Chr11g0517321 [Helianthus annuus]KAJ0503458.1 hypothetical protein HanHA300_Chr11g0424461 [Helianthus annuus]KAJ0519413.1 hypothetical protein HanHA89_Chr11g0448481 [Helianthus annuus]KAJ0687419.1 hypothetical protein HanLR1_Chr11g0425841 [Helianthus annuus]
MACLRALPRFISDHCPLILICSNKNFSPKPFRVFNSWMDRKDFDKVIRKACNNFIGVGDPDVKLLQKFKKIRGDFKKWKNETLVKEGEKERNLKEELEKLEEWAEARELSEEEEWIKSECVKELK